MNPSIEMSPELLRGMRAAYARGENVMGYARRESKTDSNFLAATLVAYDLQTGSYVDHVSANQESNDRWCAQLAEILRSFVDERSSLLEVGCGEATTLAGVLEHLPAGPSRALGFDISWSR